MAKFSRRLLAGCLLAGLSFVIGGAATEKGMNGEPSAFTYCRDVAPILFRRCSECHRSGESAPMSLMSYKEVRPWAKAIKEKLLKREMPPWHADPHYGEFRNDRRLSSDELNTVVAWVDGGAVEGDPKQLPPPPQYFEGWNIGKPDLIVSMPQEILLDSSVSDEYHYIEMPSQFTEDRYALAIEVRPGNRRIVHHISAFMISPPPGVKSLPDFTPEAMEKLRAQMEKGSIFYFDGPLSRAKPDAPVFNDGCQTASGGSATSLNGAGRNWTSFAVPLAIYSPGTNPTLADQGTGRKIPAGSKIILQLHYWKKPGAIERDRSMVGFVFAKTPPEKLIQTQLVINNYFKIPPGIERHQVNACWTADQDIRILSLLPHMHWRGVSMLVEAVYPDGRSETLLSVPRYEFSWQTVYYLKTQKAIPKGVTLKVTAFFDNSAKNRFNPDPTRAVRAGEPTTDEMMACFIDYIRADQSGAGVVEKSSRRK